MVVVDSESGSVAAGIVVVGTAEARECGASFGEAVDVARSFLDAGVPAAAICGATAGFARAGLLDAVRHTSNSRDYLLATKYGGAALYDDAPAVTDGNVITAPGTGALEFALHIFRKLDVFAPDVTDAWYNLFKTGRPEYYHAIMRLTQEAR